MSLYVIADLHLSTLAETNKSMEVFGQRWSGYMTRLKNNWERLVTDEDTVVVPGDISWALSPEEAVSDLKFIDSLPGRKILGKGNHDFWWSTMNKHRILFEKEGITSISFLFNNAHETDEFIIAGTRGWYHDEDARNMPETADFEKLVNREALRLRASLNEAIKLKGASPEKEILVFMHFPPYWSQKASEGLIEIIKEFDIKRLYFGHIHGNYTLPLRYEYEGIEMNMISADHLDFIPKIIRKA